MKKDSERTAMSTIHKHKLPQMKTKLAAVENSYTSHSEKTIRNTQPNTPGQNKELYDPRPQFSSVPPSTAFYPKTVLGEIVIPAAGGGHGNPKQSRQELGFQTIIARAEQT